VTGLARGLPMGGDLEYADEGTLSRALRAGGTCKMEGQSVEKRLDILMYVWYPCSSFGA